MKGSEENLLNVLCCMMCMYKINSFLNLAFRRLATLQASKDKALAEQAEFYENQQHIKEAELEQVI